MPQALYFLLLLACPLAMLFMMRGMMGGHGGGHSQHGRRHEESSLDELLSRRAEIDREIAAREHREGADPRP